MCNDMNGARMSWVDGERAASRSFGTTVLAVLLKAEGVHRKDTRVAGRRGLPFGQNLGHTFAQHVPPAEAEVERMCDLERENIAWPVDHDGAVTLDRKGGTAFEPSTRRGCVTARGIVHVRARRLDGGNTRSK